MLKKVYYTVTEVAAHYLISESILRRWIRSGFFETEKKLGRNYRITQEEVDRFDEKRKAVSE